MFFYRYITILFLASLLLTGCERTDLPEDLTGTIWKLDGLVESNGTWNPNEDYNEIRFEIVDSTSVRIRLPVNTCYTDFSLFTEDYMRFKSVVCTELCCDPEYADDFISLLLQVRSYFVKGKKLYLQGPGGSVILMK